ncbi:hypothetical protein [Halorarum salinum]|uniref:Uncharacterized protein n=1 Tax=Halorarum salinum TaxID=2743089 RepID=A0A7D5QBN0_9EURY|nr:hypothetical protein [Halobaculum salinum]QLG61960.1 hypothetical protein HUG12_09605 [Halobaculum salinum]
MIGVHGSVLNCFLGGSAGVSGAGSSTGRWSAGTAFVERGEAVLDWRVWLLKFLKLSWSGTRLGVSRVVLFWKGGVWTYVGISLVPVAENWPAISRLVQERSWAAVGNLFGSVGSNVAAALGEGAAAAQQLPSSTGWASVEVLGVAVPVLAWMVLLGTVVVSVFTIAWYFRTMHLGVKVFGGENVPPVLSFLFGVLVFGLLVWGVTGSFPVDEIVGMIEHLRQWLDSVHAGDVPGLEGNRSGNVTR